MKTITVRLDDKFHKELKRYALEHDITIQTLAVEALQDKVIGKQNHTEYKGDSSDEI